MYINFLRSSLEIIHFSWLDNLEGFWSLTITCNQLSLYLITQGPFPTNCWLNFHVLLILFLVYQLDKTLILKHKWGIWNYMFDPIKLWIVHIFLFRYLKIVCSVYGYKLGTIQLTVVLNKLILFECNHFLMHLYFRRIIS